MKRKTNTLIICGAIILINNLTSFGQAPAWQWAKSAGGANHDFGNCISTDDNGNSYITGYFSSPSITFGSFTLNNTGIGYTDIFIVKYDAAGNVLWAKDAGGVTDDYAHGIAIDAFGNIFIAGESYSTAVTFDNITLTNAGLCDAFIAKYDSTGNITWAKRAGGNNYEYCSGIAVDANGNSCIAGYFHSPVITFDNDTLTDNGGGDIFIAKFDSSGNVLWTKDAGGSAIDDCNSIAMDANGNTYATGVFNSDTVTFDGTALFNHTFIVKYDASGNLLWAKNNGSNANNGGGNASSIIADDNGNSYLTGTFNSNYITFGSITLTKVGTNSANIFTVKYDSMGNAVWAKRAGCGGWGSSNTYGISADAAGNIYITGVFADSIVFGSTTLKSDSIFNQDIFIAKYDALGNETFATSVSGNSVELSAGISAYPYGSVYITGGFASDSINFGNSLLTTNGVYDVFVAKLDFTTGISSQIKTLSPINIFPNPTTGKINITNSKTIDEIKVTNPLGQIIHHSKPNDKSLSLNIDDYGIYFITINSDKQIVTQKIIVQH